MVLSRFWLAIFISSIVFVVVSLFMGNSYTIDFILNGKKDDPILISEKYINQIPVFIKDSIKNAPDHLASRSWRSRSNEDSRRIKPASLCSKAFNRDL